MMNQRSIARLFGALLIALAAVAGGFALASQRQETTPSMADAATPGRHDQSTTAPIDVSAPMTAEPFSVTASSLPEAQTAGSIDPESTTPTTTTTTTTEPPQPVLALRPETEPVFFTLLNGVREAAGVAPVELDESLSTYARSWAHHLAASQVVEHSDSATLIGDRWTSIGENIGFGGTEEWINDWLVASPPHYATMTRARYTHVGVGSWQDTRGLIWTVHVYAGERSPVKAER